MRIFVVVEAEIDEKKIKRKIKIKRKLRIKQSTPTLFPKSSAFRDGISYIVISD